MSRTESLILATYVIGVFLTYGYRLSEERRWHGTNTRDDGAAYAKAAYIGIIWPLYLPLRLSEELFKDRQAFPEAKK